MTGCKDCGSPLGGKFCSECGQKDIALDRPLRALVGDAISQAFNFDGRLLRTLTIFGRQPGRLTSEFLAGRRTSFTSPLRMYFVASVLYFLIGAWAARRGLLMPESEGADLIQQETIVTDYIPRLMFFLVPFFALLLKLAFWQRLYFDHLVHSLHIHVAFFVKMILSTGADALGAPWPKTSTFIGQALSVSLLVYITASVRTVYGTGWVAATLKTLVLVSTYLFLAVGFSLLVVDFGMPE